MWICAATDSMLIPNWKSRYLPRSSAALREEKARHKTNIRNTRELSMSFSLKTCKGLFEVASNCCFTFANLHYFPALVSGFWDAGFDRPAICAALIAVYLGSPT